MDPNSNIIKIGEKREVCLELPKGIPVYKGELVQSKTYGSIGVLTRLHNTNPNQVQVRRIPNNTCQNPVGVWLISSLVQGTDIRFDECSLEELKHFAPSLVGTVFKKLGQNARYLFIQVAQTGKEATYGLLNLSTFKLEDDAQDACYTLNNSGIYLPLAEKVIIGL